MSVASSNFRKCVISSLPTVSGGYWSVFRIRLIRSWAASKKIFLYTSQILDELSTLVMIWYVFDF